MTTRFRRRHARMIPSDGLSSADVARALPRKPHYYIRRRLIQIRIDLAVPAVVHDFQEIHEVKPRLELFGGDGGLVVSSGIRRLHRQSEIVLILIDAAVAEADPFDAGR